MKAPKYNAIARVSGWFVKNSRASILILLAVFVAGLVSYTTLLKREGFPEIQFPIAFVQGSYFVDDVSVVNNKLTKPLEDAITDLEIVESINSSTTANGFSLSVRFTEDTTSAEGATEVEAIVDKFALPQAANVFVSAIDAASADGVYEFIFSVSNPELNLTELEKVANKIVAELSELNEVDEIEVKQQFEERTNPFTNQTTEERVAFSRVLYREESTSGEDELKVAPAINVGLNKAEGFDAVQLSEAVRNAVQGLRDDEVISAETTIVYGADIAVELNNQITSLEQNTLSALLVIVIVVLLFINWRAALVSALFLPFVLSGVFFSLYLMGYTLNVISLFGLILVIGLLVDDIIVVVEAIDQEKRAGQKGVKAVKEAIQKIGVADALGTLTTLAVFVPMLAIGGILGEFITLIPITVILTLAISLIAALTVFTWLADLLLISTTEKQRRQPWYRILNFGGGIIDFVGAAVARFVNTYVKSWPLVLAVIVVSLVVLFVNVSFFGPRLQFDIFPTEKDSEAISVSVNFTDSQELTIPQAIERAREVEDIIYQIGEHVEYGSYFGGFGAAGPNTSGYSIQIQLSPMEEREITAPELVAQLNADFENYEDAKVTAGIISAGPPSNEFPFQMQVYDAQTADLEVATSTLSDFIESYVYENEVSDTRLEVEEVIVGDLEGINKLDGRRFVQIQARFSEDDVTSEVLQDLESEIKAAFDEDRLETLNLASDALGFDQGIESDNLESFIQTGIAFMAALVIMYGLLVVLFNSFTQPLLIFAAIPFALAGVIPGLSVTNNPLSFFVMIGIIALAGIVVNNTILLVDYANQLRQQGKNLVDAITETVRLRFRPLVTTSVTTIAGLLPLAVTDPFWESLAFTIIFGLAASTLLVILAFPAYYMALESVRIRLYALFSRNEGEED